jgi:hypothetical protein
MTKTTSAALTCALAVVYVLAIQTIDAPAQTAGPAPEQPRPILSTISFSGGFNLTGIKGKPYSLIETTTIVREGPDGKTTTTIRKERDIRDSDGRVRSESGILKDGVLTVVSVLLTDPVAQLTATLFPGTKTALVTHLPPPKAPTPEEQAKLREAKARMEASRKTPPLTPGKEQLPPQTYTPQGHATRSSFRRKDRELVRTSHSSKTDGPHPTCKFS